MTLAAGTRLGPYEILAPPGAGDMGEVYRARIAGCGVIVSSCIPEHVCQQFTESSFTTQTITGNSRRRLATAES